MPPTFRFQAEFYRQHDADITAEVPAESFHGWTTTTIETPMDQSALVSMHAWNHGLTEELRFGPDSPYLGCFRVVEYVPRAMDICKRVFPPLLSAARSAGLPVIHVASGGAYADRYPGRQVVKGIAGEAPPEEPGPEHVPAWRDMFGMETHGSHNRPAIGEVSKHIDFPRQAAPVGDEPVCVNTRELDAYCRHEGIWNLIYIGFAINWCLLLSPGGMSHMSRRGYMLGAVPEATTAVEFAETARRETCKEVALLRVGLAFGYRVFLEDLLGALRS